MTSIITKTDSSQLEAETAVYLFDNWFDPIEAGLHDRVREFIHGMIEAFTWRCRGRATPVMRSRRAAKRRARLAAAGYRRGQIKT